MNDPHDPDRLFQLFQPDGSASWTTPRELMNGGATLEQVLEAERHGIAHFKHVHAIAEQAREAGMSEDVISEAIAAYNRKHGQGE